MKKNIAVLLCLAFSCAFSKPVVEGQVDRESALYKVGETATFTFVLRDDDAEPLQDKAELVFTRDEWTQLQTCPIDLAAIPADAEGRKTVTIQQTLDQPGFLSGRFHYSYLENGKEKGANDYAAAAYEPEKLSVGAPEPEDFMSFWQDEIKKADEQCPIDVKMEKLDDFSNEKHTAYKVSFAAPGGRVYGFLCIPTTPGRHCAIVSVPGAGPGWGTPSLDDKHVVLAMNVHFYDPMIPGKTVQESYAEVHTAKQSFMAIGGYERDKNFYHRAIIGIYRSVKWLSERPEVEPSCIGYHGHSQGGAFGFILGGLHTDFAAIVCDVPALCNHLGYKKGSAPGWPMYRWTFGITPEFEKNVVYFDAAYFASRITSPIRVSVGFIDTTCSPSSVYAAFNSIKSRDKKIFNCTRTGHKATQVFFDNIKWMVELLEKKEHAQNGR